MGWIAGAWATGAWRGTAWAVQDAPVTVPDVVGETQATGTATLEGDGFVVAVQTEYSSSVAAGIIISQSPVGGSTAANGSTVTITVSLGARSDGAGSNKKRRRYYVEVDGQEFPVESPQHAQALLERAAELSVKAIASQLEQVTTLKRARKIGQAMPKIATDAPIDVAPYRQAIARHYEAAVRDFEIQLLLRQQQEDDEAAAYLLL